MRAQGGEGVTRHEKDTKIPYPLSSSGGHSRPAAGRMLAGKHEKDKAQPVEQTQASVDTTEEDTMAAYYERMQRWKALHGWTDRWESEK